MEKKWTIKCSECEVEIKTNIANRRFCSDECRKTGSNSSRNKCDICGKRYLVGNKAWYEHIGYKSKHFCSDTCWKVLCEESAKDQKRNAWNYTRFN